MLHELANAIMGEAPLLGSILLGPAGGIAGKVIASAFGGSESAPAELVAKITAHPESSSILAGLEQRYGSLFGLLHGMPIPSKLDLHLVIEFPSAGVSSTTST
jgi:hypothetical protein